MFFTSIYFLLVVLLLLQSSQDWVSAAKSTSRSGISSKRLAYKRIVAEWKDIVNAELTLDTPFNTSVQECGVRLAPMKNNLLEWHFSFTGIEGSNFEQGVYHGKIRLHPEYPQKAPAISISTPSGRWEVNADICLSATAHHQETWNPNWNLRTLVLSLRGFMTTQPREIGSISSDAMVQRLHAQNSRHWHCRDCGVQHAVLLGNAPQHELFLIPQYLSKKEKSTAQQQKMVSRKSQKKLLSKPARKQLSTKAINVLKAFAVTAFLWLMRFVKSVQINYSFST